MCCRGGVPTPEPEHRANHPRRSHVASEQESFQQRSCLPEPESRQKKTGRSAQLQSRKVRGGKRELGHRCLCPATAVKGGTNCCAYTCNCSSGSRSWTGK